MVYFIFSDGLSYFENHGNDVIERDNDSPLGAYKSWVDRAITLPAGELRNFSVYIHRKHELPIPFRFQIWEIVDMSRNQYRLVLERRVILPGVKGVKEVKYILCSDLKTFFFFFHSELSLLEREKHSTSFLNLIFKICVKRVISVFLSGAKIVEKGKFH